MRITSVRAIPLSNPIPEERQHRTDLGTKVKSDSVLILVETDEGLTGLGASLGSPPTIKAIVEHELTPALLGEDPMYSERLYEKMYNGSRWKPALERGHSQPGDGRRGVTMEAIAGVDIAIWDLKSQALGVPVYKALGAVRDSVRGYGSGGWAPGDEAEEEMAGYAARGFSAVKMRVVGRDGFSVENTIRRVEAARRGIGGADANHAATRALEDEDGTVLAATIAPAALSGGLAHLQAIGIDPDFVTPVGLLVQPGDEDDWLEAEIGGERFLRSSRLVLPAEDALVAAVAGDIRPVVLNDEEADAALEIAFSDPPLNLRQGRFAKRRRAQGMGKRQWQLIAITLALAVLATLLIALVTLAKYSFGADQQDAAALAQARTIVPEANDLESAERALDALLIGRGGGASFGASAAALFQAVQSAPDVTIQRVAYGPDGTLSATLAAPQPDQLNQVLVPLQTSMGYVITQAPHQGAEGGTVIDITVRAP